MTFTYHSSLTHKVTNLFKNTNLNTAFQTGNTICNQIYNRLPQNKMNASGIYRLQCTICNKSYVGQTARSIEIRHRKHVRYIKTNNPLSADALHILNNRHEYGNSKHTTQLLQACGKGKIMNCWEYSIYKCYNNKIY